MIKYIKGDATSPQGEGLKIIAHICNDIGAWGAGFVLALSKKWKEPELYYRAEAKKLTWEEPELYYRAEAKKLTKENPFLTLGDVQFVQVESDIIVANMIAQTGIINKPNDYYLPPIRYTALAECLIKINEFCIAQNATLHAPRFGSGLAGGKWDKIEEVINSTMSVDVTIYDFN